ncbi:MAG: amino acid adenylation domain-containing protein, partial [Chloroflexi bacterium]|nr:amino acid adenylation domain-containing protein [Chloroflexota bacterium]
LVHSLVMDGLSLPGFYRDMALAYEALLRGEDPPSQPPRVQAADAAAWQRERMTGEQREKLEAYWADTLVDAPPPSTLPADLPQPAQPTGQAYAHQLRLPAGPVRQAAAAAKTTPFTVLMAVWQVLLHRCGAGPDIVTGTLTGGRSHPDTADMVGFFVNPVPVRTRIRGDMSFADVLDAVRASVLGALDHAELPFQQLVRSAAAHRDLGSTPLFGTMLTLKHAPEDFTLGDALASPLLVGVEHTAFDVALEIFDTGDTFTCWFAANADRFYPETVERIAGRWQRLLLAALDQPDAAIGDLPLLTEDEAQQILVAWRATDRPYPADRTIVDLLEEQAARTPDAPSVLHGDAVRTLGALNDRANRIAHLLRAEGIGPGDVVGLHLPRGIDAVTALFGVLKAGAAFVPMDTGYPSERIALMVGDSGLRMILGSHPDPVLPTLILDSGRLAAQPDHNPGVRSGPDDTAYIIYTSGSTGTPKGVVVPHRQIVIGAHWLWQAYPYGPDEVVAQQSNLSFQDFIWQVTVAVPAGVPAAIIDDDAVREVHGLVADLARHRVTRILLVPSLLRAMLTLYPDLAGRLPDLRMWISSGEPLPRALAQDFAQQMPHAVLYNLYGTSEVADITWYVPNEAHDRLPHAPIGKPIPNVRAMILDERGQPVPVGVPGELVVSAPGMSRYRQAALNEGKYISDPMDASATAYRTGDRARWLPDGNIDLGGRTDHQISVRGYRIEPGEIEAALRDLPAVAGAAVVARGGRLVAYITGGQPAAEGVRFALADRLPGYMVPDAIIPLDRLPLTPNGKVDRAALPDPGVAVAAADVPRTALEVRLVELWADVLGVPEVSVSARFTDLGGHSLLAVILLARVEAALGVRLPLSVFIDHPTVAGMARAIEAGRESGFSPLVPVNTMGDRPNLFCSTGVGGGPLVLTEPAQALGPDQPFYGLQARGMAGDYPPYASMDETAADYIAAIRRVQPTGPYFLSGYSFGGLVMVEVGRRLLSAGEQVPVLALLDTYAPAHIAAFREHPPRTRWLYRSLMKAHMHITNLFVMPWPQQINYLRLWGSRLAGAMRLALGRDPQQAAYKHRLTQIRIAHRKASEAYDPEPYPGTLTLIRARTQLIGTPHDETLGWGSRVTGELRVVEVPGYHESIMSHPRVAGVAQALRAEMDRSLRARGPAQSGPQR